MQICTTPDGIGLILSTQVIVTFYIAIVLLLVGVNFRGGGWWRPDRCLMIKIKDNFHKCLGDFIHIYLDDLIHKYLDDFIHKYLDNFIAQLSVTM